MSSESVAGLDWNALLQKAEEKVKKFEEDFAVPNQDPQTGIEEMSGVSHAYYEKQLEEMGKLLEECGQLMTAKPEEIWSDCPECRTHMNRQGNIWNCPNCGFQMDEHGRQPVGVEEEVKHLEEEIAKLEGGQNGN